MKKRCQRLLKKEIQKIKRSKLKRRFNFRTKICKLKKVFILNRKEEANKI